MFCNVFLSTPLSQHTLVMSESLVCIKKAELRSYVWYCHNLVLVVFKHHSLSLTNHIHGHINVAFSLRVSSLPIYGGSSQRHWLLPPNHIHSSVLEKATTL